MPIPFIIAGIAAAVSAATTAGAAVAATAVATGAAVTAGAVAAGATVVAAGTTVGALAGATLLTVGGVAITGTTLAGVATGAAVAFGISQVAMEESNTYSTSYISDSEKQREKTKLKTKYEEQLESLEELVVEEKDADLKSGIRKTMRHAEEYVEKNEYYNAINLIKNFKLIYAEKKKNKRVAQEAADILYEINEIRRKTLKLRGE